MKNGLDYIGDYILELKDTKGLVATVVLGGSVKPQFHAALSNMRDFNTRQGYTNIEYRQFPAVLVESGRDQVVAHAMNEKYDWIMQLDADAAQFPQDSLMRMLKTIYVDEPQIQVLGAYAQLKGGVNFPTIDTGTGTWEEHYPGEGILKVIRTGCHFFLAKTQVFHLFGPPWFRTRLVPHPARAMMEVDSFARRMLDGENPLTDRMEWFTLLKEARNLPGEDPNAVGEDSSFFDKLNALDCYVAVDTDLVVGHVDDKVIMPNDFIDAIKKRNKSMKMMMGVVG